MPALVHHGESPELAPDLTIKDRRYLRYTLQILRVLIGILLLSIIIIYLSFSSYSLFFLYLLPFALLVLYTELSHLLKRRAPSILQDSLLYPRKLVRRSFRYQIAGSFASAWTVYTDWRSEGGFWAVLLFSAIVWIIGVGLCVLALVAKKYEFLDRLEGLEPDGAIALAEVAEMDAPKDSDWYFIGKRLVRYLLHAVHLSIAGLLLAFIFINNHSIENSPFSLYVFPLIMELAVVEFCYLFAHHPPPSLLDGILTSRRLLAKAFSYQLTGAFTLGYAGGNGKFSRYHTKPARDIAYSVWVVGVVLFIIALAAEIFGLQDWLEEPSFTHDAALVNEDFENIERSTSADMERQSSLDQE